LYFFYLFSVALYRLYLDLFRLISTMTIVGFIIVRTLRSPQALGAKVQFLADHFGQLGLLEGHGRHVGPVLVHGIAAALRNKRH
jgi:hypothetical protein